MRENLTSLAIGLDADSVIETDNFSIDVSLILDDAADILGCQADETADPFQCWSSVEVRGSDLGQPVSHSEEPFNYALSRSDKHAACREERAVEKARERNRSAQSRLRLRRKLERERLVSQVAELEKAVSVARANLDSQKSRTFQLMERRYQATNSILHLRAKLAPRSTPAIHIPGSHAASLASQSDLTALAASSMPLTFRRRPATEGHARLRQQRWRPIGAFACHASLTYADLSAASGDLGISELLRHLHIHCRTAQATHAVRLGRRPGDICWHWELPFEVEEGLSLACSSNLRSLECVASFFMHWLLSLLLAAFLIDERDHLDGVNDRSWDTVGRGLPDRPPSATGASRNGPPSSAGKAAAPGDAAPVRCRCGLNETRPALAAARHALGTMLSSFASRVPERSFAARCGQFESLLARIVLVPPVAACGSATHQPNAPRLLMDDVVNCLNSVRWCMTEAHREAMRTCLMASPGQLVNRPEEHGAAMSRNDGDLATLNRSIVFEAIVMLEDERLFRQLALAVCMPAQMSFEEIAQSNVRHYSALRCSEEQTGAMVALLQRIVTHRTSMTAQYAAAATDLATLPSAACNPHLHASVQASLACCHQNGIARAAVGHNAVVEGTDAHVPLVPGLGVHIECRCASAQSVLGASAATTEAAASALQRLKDTLRDEAAAQAMFAALAYQAPCLSYKQRARLSANQLAQGAFIVDAVELCRLASKERRHASFFKAWAIRLG